MRRDWNSVNKKIGANWKCHVSYWGYTFHLDEGNRLKIIKRWTESVMVRYFIHVHTLSTHTLFSKTKNYNGGTYLL